MEAVGTEQVAGGLKISSSLIQKWCSEPLKNDDPSRARNPLDHVIQMCQSTDDLRPIEWLCQELGGYFVESSEAGLSENPRECIREMRSRLAELSSLLELASLGASSIEEATRHFTRKVARDFLRDRAARQERAAARTAGFPCR